MTLSSSTCLLTADYSAVKGCLAFCPFIATIGLHESHPVSCSFIHSLFANIFSYLDKCFQFLSSHYLILKHFTYSWHNPGPMQNVAISYSYWGQFNWYQSLCCHWACFEDVLWKAERMERCHKGPGIFLSVLYFWLRRVRYSYLQLVRTVSLWRLPENRKAIFFLCCMYSAFSYNQMGMKRRKLKRLIWLA